MLIKNQKTYFCYKKIYMITNNLSKDFFDNKSTLTSFIYKFFCSNRLITNTSFYQF